MGSIITRQTSFNAGEWSPRLQYRSDVEKYASAAKSLQNVNLLSAGGVYRRPGTTYLGEVKDSTKATRLIPFQVDTSTTYQIEMGEQYLRFWKDDALLTRSAPNAWARTAATQWAAGVAYSVNNYVWTESDLVDNDEPAELPQWRALICTQAHTSVAGEWPGYVNWGGTNPGGWGAYWTLVNGVATGEYPVGSVVSNATYPDTWYYCITEHFSGGDGPNDTEPGHANENGFFWGEIDKTYYEVPTPYLEDEIFDVQYNQINDILYLTHPNHHPHKLTRTSATSWYIDQVLHDADNFPPLLDLNTNESLTINISQTAGWAVLHSSAALFDEDMVGGYIAIEEERAAVTLNQTLANDTTGAGDPVYGNSTGTLVDGPWTLSAPGSNWRGSIRLEQQDPATSAWVLFKQYGGNADRTLLVTGATTTPVQMRVGWETTYVGTPVNNGTASLEVQGGPQIGFAEIHSYFDSQNVAGWVRKDFESTASNYKWRFGAFSDYHGHPQALALHDQRMYYGGTSLHASRFWGSQTDSYDNFREGATDSASIDFTIASVEFNRITFMHSQQDLIIGTTGAEWSVTGAGDDSITPASINVRKVGGFGSTPVQPVSADDVLLFVSRLGRKVFEFVYAFEKDGYRAPDLTQMAEHLTESGIVQVAYQQQPESILWVVTADGTCAGMTYNRDQNVMGWFRLVTEGTVESVCSTYGLDGNEDEVYFIMNRTIDSVTNRYVEKFHPGYMINSAPGWALEDAVFVDCATQIGATGLTVDAATSADPVVITTASAHGWSSGQRVRFRDMTGMTDLNDKSYTITVTGATTFSVQDLDGDDINGLGFDTYIASSGNVLAEVNTLSGVTYLEGEVVDVVGDGAYMGQVTITGGAATLPEYASKIVYGLPYTSEIKTLPLEVALKNGTSQSRIKDLHRIALNVLSSVGFKFGREDGALDPVSFRDMDADLGEAVPRYTGWVRDSTVPAGKDKDGDLIIQQSEPLPFCIRSLVMKWKVEQSEP